MLREAGNNSFEFQFRSPHVCANFFNFAWYRVSTCKRSLHKSSGNHKGFIFICGCKEENCCASKQKIVLGYAGSIATCVRWCVRLFSLFWLLRVFCAFATLFEQALLPCWDEKSLRLKRDNKKRYQRKLNIRLLYILWHVKSLLCLATRSGDDWWVYCYVSIHHFMLFLLSLLEHSKWKSRERSIIADDDGRNTACPYPTAGRCNGVSWAGNGRKRSRFKECCVEDVSHTQRSDIIQVQEGLIGNDTGRA